MNTSRRKIRIVTIKACGPTKTMHLPVLGQSSCLDFSTLNDVSAFPVFTDWITYAHIIYVFGDTNEGVECLQLTHQDWIFGIIRHRNVLQTNPKSIKYTQVVIQATFISYTFFLRPRASPRASLSVRLFPSTHVPITLAPSFHLMSYHPGFPALFLVLVLLSSHIFKRFRKAAR